MKSSLKLSIATLAVVFGMLASASAASSTYYFKWFSTGGPIYAWYSNDNWWGYGNTSGSGFVEMVCGEDWGTYSPWHPIPKKISSCGSSWSWFWEYHGVNSGGRIDACWDNFVDYAQANNRQGTEIMIWPNYQNTQPIAQSYNAQGQAVPTWSNVSIGGRSWNVYYRWWNGTYVTVTFIDRSWNSGESIPTKDFLNYCISKGFFNANWIYMEIGAGWEYANGWANCYSYGCSGI